MPHFESTVTKRHVQIVLLSELCLRMTEDAAVLLKKISLHNKTEAQPSTFRGYIPHLHACQEQ